MERRSYWLPVRIVSPSSSWIKLVRYGAAVVARSGIGLQADSIRWIDACMRQLKHEGWIHHLARHSTACFLTRGQCYISWERGMEVYDGMSCHD